MSMLFSCNSQILNEEYKIFPNDLKTHLVDPHVEPSSPWCSFIFLQESKTIHHQPPRLGVASLEISGPPAPSWLSVNMMVAALIKNIPDVGDGQYLGVRLPLCNSG